MRFREAALAAVLVACNEPARSRLAPDAPALAQASGPGPSASAPVERGVKVLEATADTDALSTIRSARLRAKAEGRVLVVYAGATWCEPCRRFDEALRGGRLDEKLANVTLLAFDVDRDADRLAAAGYAFRSIPYAALAGPDGRPLAFEEARGGGAAAWRDVADAIARWR